MSTPWSSALDTQLELIRWWRSDEGATYATVIGATDEERAEVRQGVADKAAVSGQFQRGAKLATDLAELLDHSATYWVSEEMGRFLFHAHEDIPIRHLALEDLPLPGGFVYFDSPLVFEVEGGSVAIGALMWHRYDKDRSCDLVAYHRDATRNPPLGFQTSVIWDEGEPPGGSLTRLLQTFWILSSQRIAQAEVRQADRPTRRRAQRANFAIPEDGIRVVTLRRLEEHRQADDGPHGMVDWSHRWIVSGHWRNQWYPSDEEHRPKWIEPYPKGPDDKPLVLKDRVYRFSR